jgi:EpsI family protein
MRVPTGWIPALVLGLGVLLVGGVGEQHDRPLREPIANAVPSVAEGLDGVEVVVPDDELRVAGVSDHVMRAYGPAAAPAFTVYVGYYASQTGGRAIHSPKNCLPGAGWQALESSRRQVPTAAGPVEVNRYLLQNGGQQALVLYWYQGRGRVVSNEYAVKWNLLRDAALRGRSDEALVRVLVPITAAGVDAADRLATRVASRMVPAVTIALPAT